MLCEERSGIEFLSDCCWRLGIQRPRLPHHRRDRRQGNSLPIREVDLSQRCGAAEAQSSVMTDLPTLQRDLELAKVRRYEALKRFGADSSQFAAASDVVAALETRIKEVQALYRRGGIDGNESPNPLAKPAHGVVRNPTR